VDDREQQRKVEHRLAVIRRAQEVTGNVAATAAITGSAGSASTGGCAATKSLGEEGLRDGSSVPLNSPNATQPEVVPPISETPQG
jgi:hypothetical protein